VLMNALPSGLLTAVALTPFRVMTLAILGHTGRILGHTGRRRGGRGVITAETQPQPQPQSQAEDNGGEHNRDDYVRAGARLALPRAGLLIINVLAGIGSGGVSPGLPPEMLLAGIGRMGLLCVRKSAMPLPPPPLPPQPPSPPPSPGAPPSPPRARASPSVARPWTWASASASANPSRRLEDKTCGKH
jgi:hypothetical protein